MMPFSGARGFRLPDRAFVSGRRVAPADVRYDRNRNVVCALVSKAAGVSILTALRCNALQITPQEAIELNAPSFAFVRNPFDRAVSAWVWVTTRDPIPGLSTSLSFADYIEWLCCQDPQTVNHHFRPQYLFLTTAHKEVFVDEILRWENLHAEWKKLRERFGFSELPHLNRTVHAPYQQMYTDRTRNLVGRYYFWDLTLFGYDFE